MDPEVAENFVPPEVNDSGDESSELEVESQKSVSPTRRVGPTPMQRRLGTAPKKNKFLSVELFNKQMKSSLGKKKRKEDKKKEKAKKLELALKEAQLPAEKGDEDESSSCHSSNSGESGHVHAKNKSAPKSMSVISKKAKSAIPAAQIPPIEAAGTQDRKVSLQEPMGGARPSS